MNNFLTGKTYQTRSIGDYNCIYTAKILKTTPKTVTVLFEGEESRHKVHTGDTGNQFFFPLGRYSMAPVFKA